jgi:hypothetical protein
VTSDDAKTLVEELRALLARIPEDDSTLGAIRSKSLRRELAALADDLRKRLAALNPTVMPSSFFDPSEPRLFSVFAAIALIGQDRVPLASVESPKFYGSGIYAIYYSGKLKIYKPISGTEHPIYVGQAQPAHGHARTPDEQGEALSNRLNEHRKNIVRAADSLRIDDFTCRYLVVASGWQDAAEKALIHLFRPLWNKETKVVYGFGKHGDSVKTRANKRSPWDTLHEGRGWAGGEGQIDAKSADDIEEAVKVHFTKHPVVPDQAHVLQQLLESIKAR